MLIVDRKFVDRIKKCGDARELQSYLQLAVEVEHATIPPYLTAMFSLKPGKNREIAGLILSVVMEEMLHMTIAANILIAIGGSPQINTPKFVPQYPDKLPLGIGNHLLVPIQALSKTLIRNVFMKIEEPEYLVKARRAKTPTGRPRFATIGQFYGAIQNKIEQLGGTIFTGSREKQVLKGFRRKLLFPITSVATATKAISIIVDQGEGTQANPFSSPGEPAHYFRFKEIYIGKQLVKTDTGFGFTGRPIPFDESGVYPMIKNPKQSDYRRIPAAMQQSKAFTLTYNQLLNALHESFNGTPNKMQMAIAFMEELAVQARKLVATPIHRGGKTAGPVFR